MADTVRCVRQGKTVILGTQRSGADRVACVRVTPARPQTQDRSLRSDTYERAQPLASVNRLS